MKFHVPGMFAALTRGRNPHRRARAESGETSAFLPEPVSFKRGVHPYFRLRMVAHRPSGRHRAGRDFPW